MNSLDRSTRRLATAFAAVAGYVDAVGFLMSGGFFVSFMSGNTTRFGIGLSQWHSTAAIALVIILSFVLGVVLGASLGRAVPRLYKRTAVLGLISLLLMLSLGAYILWGAALCVIPLAFAMGAQNTVFSENGEVKVGLTYMTGTLVKLGKKITVALWGGNKWEWVPYFMMWLGLFSGAVAGAFAFSKFGPSALCGAAALTLELMVWTFLIRRETHFDV